MFLHSTNGDSLGFDHKDSISPCPVYWTFDNKAFAVPRGNSSVRIGI